MYSTIVRNKELSEPNVNSAKLEIQRSDRRGKQIKAQPQSERKRRKTRKTWKESALGNKEWWAFSDGEGCVRKWWRRRVYWQVEITGGLPRAILVDNMAKCILVEAEKWMDSEDMGKTSAGTTALRSLVPKRGQRNEEVLEALWGVELWRHCRLPSLDLDQPFQWFPGCLSSWLDACSHLPL